MLGKDQEAGAQHGMEHGVLQCFISPRTCHSVRCSDWNPKGVSVRLYAPVLAMAQANNSGAWMARLAAMKAPSVFLGGSKSRLRMGGGLRWYTEGSTA